MNDSFERIPTFAELAADPEIAPLLDFEPVLRKHKRADGWTPALQRELIARLADTGTVQAAVSQIGKHVTGAKALFVVPGAESFRRSWDAAIALGRKRNRLDPEPFYAGPIPGMRQLGMGSASRAHDDCPKCAEAERADEMRYLREHQERIARILKALFFARRDYLITIADDPERRAAWDLLCGPADWDAARGHREQHDEAGATIRALRGPGLQVPLVTGFVPWLSEPGYDAQGDRMQQLEDSVARNDPRWNGTYGSADGEDDDNTSPSP